MSHPCQRTVRLPRPPDPGRLYGDLCAVLPPQYAVGQGYSRDTLRFAMEDGTHLELHLSQHGPPGCTAVFLPSAGTSTTPKQAEVHLNLFAGLVLQLTTDKGKNDD